MRKVAIIGLGWLGMPLAESLLSQGWQVKGTKRQIAQHAEITIIPFELSQEIPADLLDVDAVVINIPPSSSSDDEYQNGIKRLVSQIILQNISHLVFVSTTGVFPQKSGIFTEQSETDLQNTTAQLEKWLLQQSMQCDILRLGGLIGKNRHPVRYLAGKQNLTGANQPVNLVHQTDGIRAISLLLNHPNGKRIFNLVAPEHPSRQAYYGTMAKQLGLADLHFLADNEPLVRIISGEKICTELGFSYQYPDPFTMPID